ncbi:MAG: hypothetical protein ABSC41_05665 [Acidimicrobiales bacterium]
MCNLFGTGVQYVHFSRLGAARAFGQKEAGPTLIALDENDPASWPTGDQHEAGDTAARSQVDNRRGGFPTCQLESVNETESMVDLVTDGHSAQKPKLCRPSE